MGLQPRGGEMELFAVLTLVAEAHDERADSQCSALQAPSAAEAPRLRSALAILSAMCHG